MQSFSTGSDALTDNFILELFSQSHRTYALQCCHFAYQVASGTQAMNLLEQALTHFLTIPVLNRKIDDVQKCLEILDNLACSALVAAINAIDNHTQIKQSVDYFVIADNSFLRFNALVRDLQNQHPQLIPYLQAQQSKTQQEYNYLLLKMLSAVRTMQIESITVLNSLLANGDNAYGDESLVEIDNIICEAAHLSKFFKCFANLESEQEALSGFLRAMASSLTPFANAAFEKVNDESFAQQYHESIVELLSSIPPDLRTANDTIKISQHNTTADELQSVDNESVVTDFTRLQSVATQTRSTFSIADPAATGPSVYQSLRRAS